MLRFILVRDADPDQAEGAEEWRETVLQPLLDTPGVAKVTIGHPVAGSSQIMVAFEFTDLGTWSAWYANPDVQTALGSDGGADVSLKLWESPSIVPEPVRPGA